MSEQHTTPRDVILATIKRARKAGESEEMLARWIMEDLRNAGFVICEEEDLEPDAG